MEVATVFIALFIVIFGIFYLHYSTRNRERIALIEKGADASIFMSGKSAPRTPIWKVFILNLAVLCIGVGVGVFLASLLHDVMGLDAEVAYPGSIFLVAGISLFVGFTLSKSMIEKE